MPDLPEASQDSPSESAIAKPAATPVAPLEKEIEKLPPELQGVARTFTASFASILRTGQDPETAKLAAQAEMHEESCHLEAYKENLKNREQQSTRDHSYRMKRLNHETGLRVFLAVVCVGGLAGGFSAYKSNPATGSTIMTASFMALLYILTGRSILHRSED